MFAYCKLYVIGSLKDVAFFRGVAFVVTNWLRNAISSAKLSMLNVYFRLELLVAGAAAARSK